MTIESSNTGSLRGVEIVLESIVAVVVAAGLSSRFPGNKLLYEIRGKPIISITVSKILEAGVGRVVVVLGHQASKVFEALINNIQDPTKLIFVYNKDFAGGGMSSSVRTGIRVVPEHLHIMVHPGDVPFLKANTIRKVAKLHLEESNLITVACYKGRGGHPIIFSPALRGELENIKEETFGLKEVVLRHRKEIRRVETGDPGVLRDVDYPEDVVIAEKTGLLKNT